MGQVRESTPVRPLLPRCARTNPPLVVRPRPRDETRRAEGIGFACRQKASRGQRADMPTARLPSPTGHCDCDCDACCRHGDLADPPVVPDPDGWVSRASAPLVSRIGRAGVGRIVLSFLPLSSLLVHCKIVCFLLLSQTRLLQ
jgi:hypothetical protein